MERNLNYKILITYLACCLLMILRRPDMLLNPQPWAEDGVKFIQDYLYIGTSSTFQDYAGYLQLFPRILTIVSVELSELLRMGIQLTPLFMNIFAIFISVLCVVYLLSPHFEWLSGFYPRCLAVIAIICMPNVSEVFGSATNVNWWIGIFQFLVCLFVWKNKKFPSLMVTIPFILSGLSGPMIFVPTAFIAVILTTNYLKEKIIGRKTIALCAVTFLVSTIQLSISLARRPPSGDMKPDLINFIVTFPKTVLVGVFARPVLTDYQSNAQLLKLPTSAIIGMIVIMMILFLYNHRKSIFYFVCTYIFSLMLITFKGATFYFNLYNDPFVDVAQRYIFVSFAIVLILITSSLRPEHKWNHRIVYVIFLVLISVNVITNYNYVPFSNLHWKEEVKNYHPGAMQSCDIPINPPGFSMKIPCSPTQLP